MTDPRPGIDPSALLRLELVREERSVTVRLFGELDLASADRLRATLARIALPSGSLVYLDLAELEFLDAAGLRAILEAGDRFGDALLIRRGPPQVQRLFTLTGLDHDPSMALHRHGSNYRPRFESNVDFIRRLWDVFVERGTVAALRLVPDDVVWQPWRRDGRPLRGSEEFRDFWDARTAVQTARALNFTASGEDVVVRVELELDAGRTQALWSLYQFTGGRLIRATSFEAIEDAADDVA